MEINGLVETGLYRHVYITFGNGMDHGFMLRKNMILLKISYQILFQIELSMKTENGMFTTGMVIL